MLTSGVDLTHLQQETEVFFRRPVRFQPPIARLDSGDFMMPTNNYGVSRADTSPSEHQVNVPSVMHAPFNRLRRIGVNAANNASASAPEEKPLHERIEKLKALGLTRRQAEVAFWVAQGKTPRCDGYVWGEISATQAICGLTKGPRR